MSQSAVASGGVGTDPAAPAHPGVGDTADGVEQAAGRDEPPPPMPPIRPISAPFVAAGPSGVAIRTRLKGLTGQDERVLGEVGAHLGSLAGRDLKARWAHRPVSCAVPAWPWTLKQCGP